MRRQEGSAAVELVLVTPVLLALLLLVVAGGRIAQARAAVDGAARSAARAAAIARDPHTAVTAGERAAADRLAATRVACPAPEVTIDTGRLEPGGTVGATVTCEVPLADLAGLRLPATLTLTRSFAEPVDTHRGGSA